LRLWIADFEIVDCGFVIWKGAKHRAQGAREVIEIVKSAYAVYRLPLTKIKKAELKLRSRVLKINSSPAPLSH